jgi:hypothetical protein
MVATSDVSSSADKAGPAVQDATVKQSKDAAIDAAASSDTAAPIGMMMQRDTAAVGKAVPDKQYQASCPSSEPGAQQQQDPKQQQDDDDDDCCCLGWCAAICCCAHCGVANDCCYLDDGCYEGCVDPETGAGVWCFWCGLVPCLTCCGACCEGLMA